MSGERWGHVISWNCEITGSGNDGRTAATEAGQYDAAALTVLIKYQLLSETNLREKNENVCTY